MKFLCLASLLLGLGAGFAALSPIAQGDEDTLEHRTYAIGALTGAFTEPRAPRLGLGLRGLALAEMPPEGGDDEDEAVAVFSPDALVDLLQTLVPGLGEAEGEYVELEGDRLLVTTTPRRHAQVAALLQAFWHEAAARVDLELRRVRLAASGLGRLDPEVLGWLRSGWVPAAERARFDQALKDAGARTEIAAARVRPGFRTVLGQTRTIRYLRDYEVEIAQDSTVGDPQMDTLVTGWSCEVRPFVLQDGTVLLDAFTQTAEMAEPIRTLSLETDPFGSLDLPRVHALRATTRSRLEADTTRVLLVREDPERGLEAILASATSLDPRGHEATRLRLDVSALVTAREERLLVAHPASPGFWPRVPQLAEEVLPPFDDERLVDALHQRTSAVLWEEEGAWLGLQEGGRLVVVGPGDAAFRVRGALQAIETSELGCLRARLVVGAGEEGALLRPRTALALDVPAGGRVTWQEGFEAAFLADWGVEVAQEARVGDPIVDTLFAGIELELLTAPAPVGDVAFAEVDVRLSEAEIPLTLARPGSDCTGPIEVPHTMAVATTQDLVVRLGDSMPVSLGRLDDGRLLVLECLLAR